MPEPAYAPIRRTAVANHGDLVLLSKNLNQLPRKVRFADACDAINEEALPISDGFVWVHDAPARVAGNNFVLLPDRKLMLRF